MWKDYRAWIRLVYNVDGYTQDTTIFFAARSEAEAQRRAKIQAERDYPGTSVTVMSVTCQGR